MTEIVITMRFETDDVDQLDAAARSNGLFRFPDRVFIDQEPGEHFEAVVVESVERGVLNYEHAPVADHATLIDSSVEVIG